MARMWGYTPLLAAMCACVAGQPLSPPPPPECPPPPPPLSPPVLLGCEGIEVQQLTPLDCPYHSPCEIRSGIEPNRRGCPARISGITQTTDAVHMKIKRENPGELFKMTWNWDHGFASGAPIVFFGYNDVPDYRPAEGVYVYEDYFWSSRTDSEFEWAEDKVSFVDAYHCAGGCAGNGYYYSSSPYCGDAVPDGSVDCIGEEYPSENTGDYYVVVSGVFIEEGDDISGDLTLQFAKPPSTINADQLQAIKELWLATCWNTMQNLPVFNLTDPLPENKHWQRDAHVQGWYSGKTPQPGFLYRHDFETEGAEQDSDAIPYCDWMYEAGETPAQTYDKVMNDFDTESCLDMDKVKCDINGNVIELDLAAVGLSGQLPASFKNLDKLQKIYMGANKLEGDLEESFIWSSGDLEVLSLSKNKFTGSIPCPSHSEPMFKTLSLSKNDLTGELPTCLFTELPHLQSLSISYLKLTNARIPEEIKEIGGSFVNLFAEHAGLTGPLPRSLSCLTKVIYFHLGRNDITEFPQYAIDRMSSLYSIDLSYNQMSGDVPRFDNSSQLKRIYLEHNHFSGFDDQLNEFAKAQSRNALSAAHFSYNQLSGPLPEVFNDLLTNANRLTTVDAVGNHFRCDGDTGTWPDWAMRLGGVNAFGMCTKVPVPSAVGPAESITGGGLVYIDGVDFLASDELRCRVDDVTLPAAYISATQVTCTLPAEMPAPGTSIEVSVANYGEDWYDAQSFPQAYTPLMVTVYVPPPPAPPLETEYTIKEAEVAGIAVGCLLVVLLVCIFVCVVIRKEKQGKPVFLPLEITTAKPVASTTSTTADAPKTTEMVEKKDEVGEA